MKLGDFLLLAAICLVWGLNLVLTRLVVMEAPPLFYAFIRFALVALCLAPFLRRAPRQWGWVTLIGLCMGAGNFVLLFIALKNAPASAVGLAGQLGLPFTTLLSMIFLNERIGWRRGIGMGIAFAGVVVIAYEPESLAISPGILFGVAAVLIGSIGGVAMKRVDPIPNLEMQAWVAFVSIPLPLALSLIWEENQIGAAMEMGWPFLGALAFSVLIVSIFGHSSFYGLVKKYEVTLITPLALMTPIWAVVFGALILGEEITLKLVIGGALALSGVAMIAIRPNLRFPAAPALWRKPGE